MSPAEQKKILFSCHADTTSADDNNNMLQPVIYEH